jgi:hypothetical protein
MQETSGPEAERAANTARLFLFLFLQSDLAQQL